MKIHTVRCPFCGMELQLDEACFNQRLACSVCDGHFAYDGVAVVSLAVATNEPVKGAGPAVSEHGGTTQPETARAAADSVFGPLDIALDLPAEPVDDGAPSTGRPPDVNVAVADGNGCAPAEADPLVPSPAAVSHHQKLPDVSAPNGALAGGGAAGLARTPAPEAEGRALAPAAADVAVAGESPPARVFDGKAQWLLVTSELSPQTLLRAAGKGRGDGMMVSLAPRPGQVEVLLRPLPKSDLVARLWKLPLWSVLAVVHVLFCTVWPVLYALLSIVSLDFVGLLVGFWGELFTCAAEGWASLRACFVFQAEWFRVIRALSTGVDYYFVPRDVPLNVTGNVLAEISPRVSQVVRISLSGRTLQSRAKKSGCLGALLKVTLFPVWLLYRLIVSSGRRYEFLAFVDGAPLDLAEASEPEVVPKKRRRNADVEEERVIYLVTLHPLDAERVVESVASALGRTPVVIDDAVARKTLWRQRT